jgi:putative oxidoreductase
MQNSGLRNMIGCCDNLADSLRDPLLLIGRILIAAVFLMTVWTGGPAAAYLKSLNYILPDFMSLLAHLAEWIIVVTLILGVATRYGALLAFVFVVIARVTAHRYWKYQQAAQTLH